MADTIYSSLWTRRMKRPLSRQWCLATVAKLFKLVLVFKESMQMDTRIIGVELFAQVAAVACVCKKDFCKPYKTPCMYVREPFQLH